MKLLLIRSPGTRPAPQHCGPGRPGAGACEQLPGEGPHPDLGAGGPQAKEAGTMSWRHSYCKVLGFLISPDLLLVLPPANLAALPPFLRDLCPLGFVWTWGVIESMALVS